MITGGPAPTTVTVKLPTATLPAASVAWQLTALSPTGKVEPEAGTQTAGTVEQLSVAVTLKVTTAVFLPNSAGTLMLTGKWSTGLSWSTTVTVNALVVLLPATSAAMQTTVVMPLEKIEPDGGVQTRVAPGGLSRKVTV